MTIYRRSSGGRPYRLVYRDKTGRREETASSYNKAMRRAKALLRVAVAVTKVPKARSELEEPDWETQLAEILRKEL